MESLASENQSESAHVDKKEIYLQDVKTESHNEEKEVCEPRMKRRRQFKTLRSRFINPMTVKGRMLYSTTTASSNSNNNDADNSSVKSDKYHFLTVFNLPESWNEDQIKEFIEQEIKPVNNIEMLVDNDEHFIGTIQIEFDDPAQCKLAKTKLKGKELEGKRLEAYDSEDESDSDAECTEPQAKRRNEGLWRPDIDIWEKDPKGLYGLKPEYLKVMGIQPPIDRWVHVTNFRASKQELREVMELAGEVMVCSVVSGQQMYAKVMYSHPLEAVQAVSMLHNRQYLGSALKVVMDTCPASSSYLLPNGLLNVGPGLGYNGTPLRDIVRHYERFVKGFNSSINKELFHERDEKLSSSVSIDANFRKMKQEIPQAITNKFVPKNVPQSRSQSQNSGSNTPANNFRQTVPQFNQAPQSIPVVFGPKFPGQAGPSSGPVGPGHGPGPMPGPPLSMPGPPCPMPGPIRGPNTPMSGPSMPNQGRPMPGPGPGPGPSGPMMDGPPGVSGPMLGPGRPMQGPMDSMKGPTGPMNEPSRPRGRAPSPGEPATVELCNLPLNTTFPLLSEKMGECGPVMSLQLTSPGCAIVKYSNRASADRCYKKYNNACVMSNIIKVRYL